MYRNYEGDLLYGKYGPAETCPSYTCDRLTLVSGCIVEATNEDIAPMGFRMGFQEARAVQISELFGSVGLILLDELQLQTGFAKSGWVATFVEFVGVAVVGAKTEALFPGRVPHVRPSVHGLKKTGRSPFQRFLQMWRRHCGQEQESLP